MPISLKNCNVCWKWLKQDNALCWGKMVQVLMQNLAWYTLALESNVSVIASSPARPYGK